ITNARGSCTKGLPDHVRSSQHSLIISPLQGSHESTWIAFQGVAPGYCFSRFQREELTGPADESLEPHSRATAPAFSVKKDIASGQTPHKIPPSDSRPRSDLHSRTSRT